jgi:hypothetical protein
MLNTFHLKKRIIEAIKIMDSDDDEIDEDELARKEVASAFSFVNEDWVLEHIRLGLIDDVPGFHGPDGYLDADWIVFAAKNDSKFGAFGKSLSYKESICLEQMIKEMLIRLDKQGKIIFNRSQLFNLGTVSLADYAIAKEVEDFNLDEAVEYDTTKYHSYHDWRREVVNPALEKIIEKLDKSWIISMLSREQMEKSITQLVPRIDIDFAIDTKTWTELCNIESAKDDNLSIAYQMINSAAKLHVYHLLDELALEGIIETVNSFGGPNKPAFFKLSDSFMEKETADFNLDEGKSFSEFTSDDKRLISIIKKEYPLSFVKKLIVKEIISNQSTSTRSDTCFRLLVRRNVARVMCSNQKREDVWNAINEYTEFAINVMCQDGELATYEDEQTGHDMIKLSDKFIDKEVKDFTLDESFNIDCGEQELIDKILSKYDDEWMLNYVKTRYFEELEPVSIVGMRGAVIRDADAAVIEHYKQSKISFGSNFDEMLVGEASELAKDLIISLIAKGILTITSYGFDGRPKEAVPSESYLEKETSDFNLDEALRVMIRGILT